MHTYIYIYISGSKFACELHSELELNQGPTIDSNQDALVEGFGVGGWKQNRIDNGRLGFGFGLRKEFGIGLGIQIGFSGSGSESLPVPVILSDTSVYDRVDITVSMCLCSDSASFETAPKSPDQHLSSLALVTFKVDV